MNEEQKKHYLERYYQEKQKGVKFWPDIIYKDLLVSFAIFLLLVGLAAFMGVPQEPKVDPTAQYTPRPEWYFLWLFQMLELVPGAVPWLGTVIVPTLLLVAMFLLPFFDKNPRRHWKQRTIAISVMSVIVLAMVGLTIWAAAATPPQEEVALAGTLSEQISLGEGLYLEQCGECHGPDGDVKVIEGVEGLEGTFVSPISSKDVIYTRTDDTLINVITQGQQELGMPPFGSAFGGPLSPGDIEAIVAYMRYTWDDRVEKPAESTAGGIPALAAGEVPSWEKHVEPIFRRYCASCHRPGKKNNDYFVQTYEEALTSGQNAPSLVAGDLNSNLIRMLHREEIPDVGGAMPPTKALPADMVSVIEQWVMAGMPNTVADAEKLSPVEVPAVTPTLTATITATQQLTLTVVPTLTLTVTPTLAAPGADSAPIATPRPSPTRPPAATPPTATLPVLPTATPTQRAYPR